MTVASPSDATVHASADVPESRRRPIRHRLRRRLLGPPSWVTLVQLFLAFGWLRAAAAKVLDPSWWDGTTVAEFVADHDTATLAWFRPVVDVLVSSQAAALSGVVLAAQLGVGAALLVDRGVGWALATGATMNVAFVAVGAVDPSVFYLLAQSALALWLLEYRAHRRVAREALTTVGAVSLWIAAASAPSISTLDPKTVVEDPAMMLTFFGLLSAACAHVAATRWNLRASNVGGPGRPQSGARR